MMQPRYVPPHDDHFHVRIAVPARASTVRASRTRRICVPRAQADRRQIAPAKRRGPSPPSAARRCGDTRRSRARGLRADHGTNLAGRSRRTSVRPLAKRYRADHPPALTRGGASRYASGSRFPSTCKVVDSDFSSCGRVSRVLVAEDDPQNRELHRRGLPLGGVRGAGRGRRRTCARGGARAARSTWCSSTSPCRAWTGSRCAVCSRRIRDSHRSR